MRRSRVRPRFGASPLRSLLELRRKASYSRRVHSVPDQAALDCDAGTRGDRRAPCLAGHRDSDCLGFFWDEDKRFIRTGSGLSICASVLACWSGFVRSEEHTSELQSLAYLVCRLLLEKKKINASCDCVF